jgi:hypothetical protein
MRIAFEPRTVLLHNVQTRVENHGEDLLPAIDLGITLTGGNDLLNLIHPDLRPALYVNRGRSEEGLDLPVDDLPNIKIPAVEMPIRIQGEQVGMHVEIAYGTNAKAGIVLSLVKLHKVRISAVIEGGSVELKFSLSTSNEVTERVVGKLAMLQGHEITLGLALPKVEQTDMEGKKAKAKKEAEELFATPPQTPEEALADTAKA